VGVHLRFLIFRAAQCPLRVTDKRERGCLFWGGGVSFSATKTVSELSRPFVGRFGPYVLVTAPDGHLGGGVGVYLRFSIFRAAQWPLEVTVFPEKWPKWVIFTLFELSRPVEGRCGRFFVVGHSFRGVWVVVGALKHPKR
jgi:hypothetical protein